MKISWQNSQIVRHRVEDTSARFGRLGRLTKAHGLQPDVRVRPLRAGEGRPWRGALLTAALALTAPFAAAADLPEGWAEFHDAIVEVHAGRTEGAEERWLVMRYLAPGIAREGGSLGYDDVALEMDALCNGQALATAKAHESPVDQIVITLMDRVVERGQPDPQATQFIASYSVTETGCEWQ